MPKVMLRLRDLNTGDGATKEFDDVDSALPWLRERPHFTEVLGVVFEGLTREDNERMKSASRPLDEEERAAVARHEAEAQEQRRKAAEARAKENEEAEKLRREAAAKAPPDRPMELRYRYDQEGLSNTDQLDQRPITDEAREAVMEWVKERMEWVAGRGQTVGEAKLSVYPTTVPAGKERVLHGSFVPVTAPPKGEN